MEHSGTYREDIFRKFLKESENIFRGILKKKEMKKHFYIGNKEFPDSKIKGTELYDISVQNFIDFIISDYVDDHYEMNFIAYITELNGLFIGNEFLCFIYECEKYPETLYMDKLFINKLIETMRNDYEYMNYYNELRCDLTILWDKAGYVESYSDIFKPYYSIEREMDECLDDESGDFIEEDDELNRDPIIKGQMMMSAYTRKWNDEHKKLAERVKLIYNDDYSHCTTDSTIISEAFAEMIITNLWNFISNQLVGEESDLAEQFPLVLYESIKECEELGESSYECAVPVLNEEEDDIRYNILSFPIQFAKSFINAYLDELGIIPDTEQYDDNTKTAEEYVKQLQSGNNLVNFHSKNSDEDNTGKTILEQSVEELNTLKSDNKNFVRILNKSIIESLDKGFNIFNKYGYEKDKKLLEIDGKKCSTDQKHKEVISIIKNVFKMNYQIYLFHLIKYINSKLSEDTEIISIDLPDMKKVTLPRELFKAYMRELLNNDAEYMQLAIETSLNVKNI
jgi:hypothetical protein